jgi:hypothetical protein
MPAFYGAIDLVKNELRNAVIQNLGSAPASPLKGQVYMDSTANVLYWFNGTVWVSAAGAAASSTVTTAAIGDAPVPGTAGTFSQGDHKHGMPAFAATVTAGTTYGLASAVGAAVTLAHADHGHGTPALPSVNTLAPTTGVFSMAGFAINNVADPTNPQDAATKNYVDNAIAGLSWKAPVRAASTANIAALTGTMTLDGVALNAGDRVLVKNQTTQTANGIYVVAAGAWARSADAATAAQLVQASVYVEDGTTQADSAWTQTTNPPITVGTTNLVFVQFSGAGTYSAGNGLTLTGNVFAVGAGTGILSTPGQVAVDTTVIATQAYVNTAVTGMTKKYATALAGTASPEVITHNLNTQDVAVMVHASNTPFAFVQVDWQATSVNTVTILYNPALGAGYRVVVMG